MTHQAERLSAAEFYESTWETEILNEPDAFAFAEAYASAQPRAARERELEPHDYWPDYKTAVEENAGLHFQLAEAWDKAKSLAKTMEDERTRAETAERDLATAQAHIARLEKDLSLISVCNEGCPDCKLWAEQALVAPKKHA